MAEESTYNTTQEDSLELENVTSRNISKKFGKTEDYIELHIYNSNDQLLYSETNFTDYTLPNNTDASGKYLRYKNGGSGQLEWAQLDSDKIFNSNSTISIAPKTFI